jgi:hypothetical protein
MKREIYNIKKGLTKNVRILQDLDINSKGIAEFRVELIKCTLLGRQKIEAASDLENSLKFTSRHGVIS